MTNDTHLPYNFHDAGITHIILGPRHELTLFVDLDEPPSQSGQAVYIRFGGIKNYEESEAYVKKIPQQRSPNAYRARIDNLKHDHHTPQKQGHPVIRLELEGIGEILIHYRKVTSGQNTGSKHQKTSHD